MLLSLDRKFLNLFWGRCEKSVAYSLPSFLEPLSLFSWCTFWSHYYSVHFLKIERHGVSLTWLIKFPIEQISDLSNFRLKIRGFTNTLIPWCLKKSWITYSTYFNDKHEFFKATKFNDNQLSLFFPPKKAV